MKTDDIVNGIGGTSDDFVWSENLSGLINRHVVLSEMDSVRTGSFYQFHVVVKDEFCSMLTAKLKRFLGAGQHFFFRGVLHAQLDPFASSFQSHAYPIYISDRGCEM